LLQLKPLSPETIKAQTAKRSAEASIWPNQETLSQCNTPATAINFEAALSINAVTNRK
jgi:hypothetical protein